MKKNHILLLAVALLAAIVVAALLWKPSKTPWGFAREVSPTEAALRKKVTDTAESWLNANQFDGSHQPIIDIYNSHEPLAVNYKVTYTDQWCATFGSTVAIQCGLTGIIPTECGCQRQIELFRSLNAWQEDDAYVPLPGDYVFYSMSELGAGDCTAWSDHVGIVAGTYRDRILVIEGNNGGYVKHRIIAVDDIRIRGYATPDYASLCEDTNQ